jgi:hypothetical protein
LGIDDGFEAGEMARSYMALTASRKARSQQQVSTLYVQGIQRNAPSVLRSLLKKIGIDTAKVYSIEHLGDVHEFIMPSGYVTRFADLLQATGKMKIVRCEEQIRLMNQQATVPSPNTLNKIYKSVLRRRKQCLERMRGPVLKNLLATLIDNLETEYRLKMKQANAIRAPKAITNDGFSIVQRKRRRAHVKPQHPAETEEAVTKPTVSSSELNNAPKLSWEDEAGQAWIGESSETPLVVDEGFLVEQYPPKEFSGTGRPAEPDPMKQVDQADPKATHTEDEQQDADMGNSGDNTAMKRGTENTFGASDGTDLFPKRKMKPAKDATQDDTPIVANAQ